MGRLTFGWERKLQAEYPSGFLVNRDAIDGSSSGFLPFPVSGCHNRVLSVRRGAIAQKIEIFTHCEVIGDGSDKFFWIWIEK